MQVIGCGIHGFGETIGIDVDEFRVFWKLDVADEQAEVMRRKREELFADDDEEGGGKGKKKGRKKRQVIEYGLNGEPIHREEA